MQRRLRLSGLLLWAAATILGPPASAQGAPSGNRVHSSTECWRRLAGDIRTSAPSICGRPTHWFLAVDVSKSTIGPGAWHDKVQDLLMDWAKYTVVPGDRVTLLTFAHDLSLDGPLDVDAASTLQEWLVSRIDIRPPPASGRGRTSVRAARERLLESAARADHRHHVVLTMLLADRATDDTGGQPAESRPDYPEPEFLRRFGRGLAPYESTSRLASGGVARQGIEGLAFYKIAKEPEDCRVYCFHSVSTRAGNVPTGGVGRRYIPGPGGRTQVIEHEPVLRDTVSRAWLVVQAISLLIAIALAIVCLRDNRAATLEIGGESEDFRWWPFWRPHSKPLRVTVNVPGLRAIPLQPGLNDPLVANVELNAMSLAPWTATVTRPAETTYKLRLRDVGDERARWQEQVVLRDGRLVPDEPREYLLEVNSPEGEIGRGDVIFRINDALRRRVKQTLWVIGVCIALGVVGPTAVALMPVPPPTIIRPPEREPLCNIGLLSRMPATPDRMAGEIAADPHVGKSWVVLPARGRRLAQDEDRGQTNHLRRDRWHRL